MPKDAQTVVLCVGMHCDACKRKVSNAVGSLSGVYEVTPDIRTQKVIVKGNFDSNEVLKTVWKTGKSATILELVPIEQKPKEPDPNPPAEPPKPPDPPKIVIVTLKVMMHCDHCKRKVEKALRALAGVQSVRVDYCRQEVFVTGTMDPAKVLQRALETGKYAVLVPPPPPPEEKKKEAKEEKKEEKKEEAKEEKKEEEKVEAKEEKKEEAKEEKKEEAKEEKKEEAKEEKKEEKKEEIIDEKTQELIDIGARPYLICRGPPNCITFSDENPNGCTIM